MYCKYGDLDQASAWSISLGLKSRLVLEAGDSAYDTGADSLIAHGTGHPDSYATEETKARPSKRLLPSSKSQIDVKLTERLANSLTELDSIPKATC